ncbi:hypothetical protein [Paenibacillus sp. F4]|uniref:hypothetical protein n=1 Tax=Paenibacillus sp. F4 TaxID=357385 RepID=UPI000C9F0F85|nr:hypothetical protein [Paenibacillus sp. F4]PNQ81940.1 hypothetical protein C1T21_06615 [Paenibacillus sp. F4]
MKMDIQKHVIDMLRSAKTVFVAQDKEGNGLAIDPHDALGLLDSLQQQVNGLNEESLANFQTAAERGKQLAERDRTIARLQEMLGKAQEELQDLKDGEFSTLGVNEATGFKENDPVVHRQYGEGRIICTTESDIAVVYFNEIHSARNVWVSELTALEE